MSKNKNKKKINKGTLENRGRNYEFDKLFMENFYKMTEKMKKIKNWLFNRLATRLKPKSKALMTEGFVKYVKPNKSRINSTAKAFSTMRKKDSDQNKKNGDKKNSILHNVNKFTKTKWFLIVFIISLSFSESLLIYEEKMAGLEEIYLLQGGLKKFWYSLYGLKILINIFFCIIIYYFPYKLYHWSEFPSFFKDFIIYLKNKYNNSATVTSHEGCIKWTLTRFNKEENARFARVVKTLTGRKEFNIDNDFANLIGDLAQAYSGFWKICLAIILIRWCIKRSIISDFYSAKIIVNDKNFKGLTKEDTDFLKMIPKKHLNKFDYYFTFAERAKLVKLSREAIKLLSGNSDLATAVFKNSPALWQNKWRFRIFFLFNFILIIVLIHVGVTEIYPLPESIVNFFFWLKYSLRRWIIENYRIFIDILMIFLASRIMQSVIGCVKKFFKK